jgi:hypothetical protein
MKSRYASFTLKAGVLNQQGKRIKGGLIAGDARKAFPLEIILKNTCVNALA